MLLASGLAVWLTNGMIATLCGSCSSSFTTGSGPGNSISLMAHDAAPSVKKTMMNTAMAEFFIFIEPVSRLYIDMLDKCRIQNLPGSIGIFFTFLLFKKIFHDRRTFGSGFLQKALNLFALFTFFLFQRIAVIASGLICFSG